MEGGRRAGARAWDAGQESLPHPFYLPGQPRARLMEEGWARPSEAGNLGTGFQWTPPHPIVTSMKPDDKCLEF